MCLLLPDCNTPFLKVMMKMSLAISESDFVEVCIMLQGQFKSKRQIFFYFLRLKSGIWSTERQKKAMGNLGKLHNEALMYNCVHSVINGVRMVILRIRKSLGK